MARIGLCCMLCCYRDYQSAVRQMLLINIVAAIATMNWILWSTIFVPPNFKVASSIVGLVFKAIIFCIQAFVLYATLSAFIKHKKDFSAPRQELFMYGKISTYLGVIKLFCLVGLLCLTSIAISNAASMPGGFRKLGPFFVVARVVLAGCFALEIWGVYMMVKLMEITRHDIYTKPGAGNSINMAQGREQKALKSNSHADLNKVDPNPAEINDDHQDPTKIDNVGLDNSNGMAKTDSESIVNNNEFRQIEVNQNE